MKEKLTELTKLAALRPRSYRLSYALRSDDTKACKHQHSFVERSDNFNNFNNFEQSDNY